jgi:hypothetical protein
VGNGKDFVGVGDEVESILRVFRVSWLFFCKNVNFEEMGILKKLK